VARRLLGTVDARVVIPLSAALGATLLPAADLAARLLFFPAELPVGIWLTALGVPLFLVLARRQLRVGHR
jgi:ABC-type Fe3+-siderophore transport system permease subunit